MKKNIVKSLALVMSLTCLCVGFGGCAVKDKMDGWFDKVFAETPSTEDSVDEENKDSSTEDKDDSTNKDDTTTGENSGNNSASGDSTDSSAGDSSPGAGEVGGDSTDSSAGDSSPGGGEVGGDSTGPGINGDNSSITDILFFTGIGTSFEDDMVYIHPELGECFVGDVFRIQAEAKDGSKATFKIFGNSQGITVDDEGIVTAIGEGMGLVNVSFPHKAYIVVVIVSETPLETDFEYFEAAEGEVGKWGSIYIRPIKATMTVGEQKRIKAVTSFDTLTYSVDEGSEGIVTVDNRGNVTALSAGTATITVSKSSGVKETVTITVK